VAVTGYSGVYDGQAHGLTGSATGVNGEALAGLNLGAKFTNPGTYTVTWAFTDVTGNYNDQSGVASVVISKADATVPPSPNSPADHFARASVAVFDPEFATWYVRSTNSPGAPDVGRFAYGGRGWIPLSGDWNGDGVATIGVFDPATATWYLKNSTAPGAPDIAPFRYGAPGWIPVVGDWDGDGVTTIGVFDPATATWYLKNSNRPGAPDITPFRYGGAGWVPVVGDWDGDRKDTIGVFNPSTVTWYVKNTNSPGAPDVAPFAYGGVGWTPVSGDWNGDGRDTIGVYDPIGQFGKPPATWYLKNTIAPGAPDIAPFAYGVGTWVPVPGEWTPPPAALHATEVGPGAAALTQEQLSAAVAAALGRLGGAALPPVRFEVQNLGGDYLGLAFPTDRTVWIDDDGAGNGWFVDPTPGQDEEFLGGAGGPLSAVPGGPADGRMDLLTAVFHELGHVAGLPDRDAAVNDGSVMAGTLRPGIRRV
jgi:hypothetical protein